MDSHTLDSWVKGPFRCFRVQASQVTQIQQNFRENILRVFGHNNPMSLPSTLTNALSDHGRRNYSLSLHGLAALRILIVLGIGLGYASTMGIGTHSPEWGQHWGFDPSWYGIQLLFIFSGFLAARSMTNGRSIGEFITSRIKSIWPALIGATLLSVCFIYPIMCAPDAAVRMSAGDLAVYTLKTIFLIDPGARMPGLMDDAKYMCLLQGAIWTLQVGLLLHAAFLIGWLTRILQNRKLALALSILSIALYVIVFDSSVRNPELMQSIEPILPILRLGYAYLVGVAIFMWQDKLRLNKRRIIVSTALIALTTTVCHTWLPWTPFLEIMGVTVWLTLCLGFLHNVPVSLKRCPRLAPLLYVSIWPAAQIIVALDPSLSQMKVILLSTILAVFAALCFYLLFRQARIQPARL